MSPKHLVLAAVSAIAVCAANVALAQDEAPPAEDALTRMQEMSDAFHATTDPAERRALMQQHMALMMQQMHEGGGMMMTGGAGTTADGEAADLPRMQSHMDMMHQMMMQMMSQQDMMMRMQEQEEDDDE